MTELSPAQISGASFRTTRKGYDPDEVDAFLAGAARALEDARQQATAMEARARAAVARLQEVNAAVAEAAPEAGPVDPNSSVQIPAAEADTISRTLLLAQRTADTTVAEAHAEADRIVQQATVESETTIDSTREMSAQILEDARVEARRASESERQDAENEVQALVARREFLIGDVDQLERFLIDQRDRLRAAARQIEALCERVPAGLGSLRPPVLSASDDGQPGDPTQELTRPTRRSDAADDSGGDTSSGERHDDGSQGDATGGSSTELGAESGDDGAGSVPVRATSTANPSDG